MVHRRGEPLQEELRRLFGEAGLLRPMRVSRYGPGDELSFDVTGVFPARPGRVSLVVEDYVGGGFAGQVYRVRLTGVEAPEGPIEGLETGGTYAMKILVPPSGLARFFRNLLYGLGFQGAFSLQANPAAVRAGALWQKLIRRAAALRFGSEKAVVDIHATFVDPTLGSCGELSEWVDGRTWRFEVNDRLDLLRAWSRGRAVDPEAAGSPEYRAKRQFMADFVRLLHELGAHELARQYEWWTCKSQPNVLKRRDTEDEPGAGLTAVDFRPGLALLPFLPMSPADVWLILKGIARGSLVQFDRGDLRKLEAFVGANRGHFGPLALALDDLREAEAAYRSSLLDVPHHHVRLLYSRRLWAGLLEGAATAAQTRGRADAAFAERMRRSRVRTWLFTLIGLVPFLGGKLQKLWGRADLRAHAAALFTRSGYLLRALAGRAAEALAKWTQSGRVRPETAQRLLKNFGFRISDFGLESKIKNQKSKIAAAACFLLHGLLAWFPRWLHRLLTDPGYAREKLAFVFVRPLRLYFNAAYREQWLRDMVTEGHRNHMLTEDDADTILRQLGEPFIQKYLKCLAVHVCTLPITKAVAMAMALVYVAQHPDLSWGAAWGVAIAIIVFFQTTPISPGSIVRGLYTLGVVIRERDLKNYNIAAVLSFFKTIGYLAFPIQMARRYPALARFMAGHWATGVVHALPVFGERGALLEHGMFQLFYNRPLTVRRRLLVRAEREAGPKPRDWHTVLCAAGAAALLVSVEAAFLHETGEPPQFAQAWWAVLGALLPCGWFVAREARGLSSGRRIVAGALTGAFAALLHIGGHIALKRLILGHAPLLERSIRRGLTLAPREMFFFALLAALGALLAEVLAPMPCPHLSRDAGSPKSETRNPKESQSTKHQFPE